MIDEKRDKVDFEWHPCTLRNTSGKFPSIKHNRDFNYEFVLFCREIYLFSNAKKYLIPSHFPSKYFHCLPWNLLMENCPIYRVPTHLIMSHMLLVIVHRMHDGTTAAADERRLRNIDLSATDEERDKVNLKASLDTKKKLSRKIINIRVSCFVNIFLFSCLKFYG